MVERLGLTLLLILLALAAFAALRLIHARRAAAGLAPAGATLVGTPRLLYFRGDHCGSCASQARVLDQVVPPFAGRLQIERIDAEQDPDTAARFAVFTLPTTMLVDGQGRVRHINYGLTPAGTLARQLEEIL